jgi:hypothetical protein
MADSQNLLLATPAVALGRAKTFQLNFVSGYSHRPNPLTIDGL